MKLVYAALQDLFFSAKIKGTADKTGAHVIFVTSYIELMEKIRENKPDLVIADLNGFLTPAHLSAIKGVEVIGYLSHVQTDLRKRFENTCRIMTQSQFSEKLPQLLS